MICALSLMIATAIFAMPLFAQRPAVGHSWIATSNEYANQLLAVEMKHHPELGSEQGLSQFDDKVSQPTSADEDRQRQEAEDVVAKLKAAAPKQSQKEVAQDLEIMIRKTELQGKLIGRR